ncbi:hypothetical protein KY284_025225 [Solanum tuberosum]|nr:hypothetical protein KY284_025225 [Solanum tuberosum]
MCGVNPKAALASHAFLASSCDGVVPRAAAGILGFGRRSGHGAFTGSYLPKTNAPANDGRARLEPVRSLTGAAGSCGARCR